MPAKPNLTPKILKQFCDVLIETGDINTTCEQLGLQKHTVDLWLRKGGRENDPRTMYYKLYHAVKETGIDIERQRGRGTKFSDEVQSIICDAIREGHYFETACGLAGVTVQTGYEWLQRGLQSDSDLDSRFANFAYAVQIANAQSEQMLLDRLTTAPEQWQRFAWILERRFRDRWGRQVTIEQKDWRKPVITAIQMGEVNYLAVADAYGEITARSLFQEAGVTPLQLGSGDGDVIEGDEI